jgi:hypothetical protein
MKSRSGKYAGLTRGRWQRGGRGNPVWSNRFHWCALAAGFLAAGEGRLGDSRYVQGLAYELYEDGAFAERIRRDR